MQLATPTNRHRALGLDIGLIDLTKEFWSQVGTFFQPCMAQNGYKIDTKMVPKWYQNGTKMVPRWSLGGSWGHLGGKLGPRWSQEGSKVEKVDSFPPCWGPSWDPIFHIFITRVVQKRLGDPVGWHVVSRHQFLGSLDLPWTLKTWIPSHSGDDFHYFSFLLFGWLWGVNLAPFWYHFGPSWAMLGTKLAKNGSWTWHQKIIWKTGKTTVLLFVFRFST